jgi:hypothetical protein
VESLRALFERMVQLATEFEFTVLPVIEGAEIG